MSLHTASLQSSDTVGTPEIIMVAADIDEVVCDGGMGPLGHPQVWYRFDKNTQVCCHYCGRKFIKTFEK